VFNLGSERHFKQISLESIDSLQNVGCFAFTEVGFGNNAIMMETTATWDSLTKEWEINSPTPISSKYWITNGAKHAHFAVVFAQTFVNNKHEGVHAFLVKIRNEHLQQLEHVTIQDMGHKMQNNGVDNALLRFNKIRVPWGNLLNKFADIDPETSTFKCDIPNQRKRLLAVADRLLSGRMCIANMMLGCMKLCLTVVLK